MFTGHIHEVGMVVAVDQTGIAVRTPKVAASAPGSVCLNGVRLMVAQLEHETGVLQARLTGETRRRSTLDRLRPGAWVNVETPLALGDPLGRQQPRPALRGRLPGAGAARRALAAAGWTLCGLEVFGVQDGRRSLVATGQQTLICVKERSEQPEERR
ncbi:hypothetical protein [Sphaerisporangium fuscum]|uniref:hypothetical protein n=1 Tax=Sphaerisporangium fuscum TaxID=2835868 RepID=UPI001BDD048E|nr:hypothetical protein [Sphaerisporangium fuscum]